MFFYAGFLKCALLNFLRLLSVLGLVLVLAASIVIMSEDIKTLHNPHHDAAHDECEYVDGISSIPNQPSGAFRSFSNRVLTVLQCVVLLWTEIGFPQSMIKQFLPILDSDHSLFALGFFEMCIAVQFMSQFLDSFPLGAAFFLFVVSILNMGCFWVERPRYFRSATFWIGRNQALSKLESGSRRTPSEVNSVGAASIFTAKEQARPQYGFGRQDAVIIDTPSYITKPPAAAPPTYTAPSRYGKF